MRIGYADYEKRLDRIKKWDKLEKLLGFKLPLCYILTAIQGYKIIDIIKLDEILKTPDGISTKDFITFLYGDECMALVDELIN